MAGNVGELLRSFNAEYSALKAEADQLGNQIEAMQEQIEVMQKQLDSICLPNWVDAVVKPLAEQLAEKSGDEWKAVVRGPCGLFSKATIYLVKNPDVPMFSQPHLRLTVQPCFHFVDDDSICLVYETGEIDSTYPKDSLGEFHGGNMVTAPLPNTIDEIVPLLVEFDTTKEGGK